MLIAPNPRSTAQNYAVDDDEPETRVGLDGKERRMPRRAEQNDDEFDEDLAFAADSGDAQHLNKPEHF